MSKNRIIFLASASVFFVGLAQAAAMPMATTTLSPFYIGGSLGLMTDANSKNNTVSTTVFPGIDAIDDISLYNKSFRADLGHREGVHLGVRKIFNHYFYLGGEVFVAHAHAVQQGKASLTDYEEYQSHETKMTIFNRTSVKSYGLQYGFDVMPGFMMTPRTIFFANLGVVRSKLKLTSASYYSEKFEDPIIGEDTASSIVRAKNTHYETGFRFGLGVERFVTDKLSLRLSDIFTVYPKVNANALGKVRNSEGFAVGTLHTNSAVKFRTQTVSLDFNYSL